VLHPIVGVEPFVLGQGVGLEVAGVPGQEPGRPGRGVIRGEVDTPTIRVVGVADARPQVRFLGAVATGHA